MKRLAGSLMGLPPAAAAHLWPLHPEVQGIRARPAARIHIRRLRHAEAHGRARHAKHQHQPAGVARQGPVPHRDRALHCQAAARLKGHRLGEIELQEDRDGVGAVVQSRVAHCRGLLRRTGCVAGQDEPPGHRRRLHVYECLLAHRRKGAQAHHHVIRPIPQCHKLCAVQQHRWAGAGCSACGRAPCRLQRSVQLAGAGFRVGGAHGCSAAPTQGAPPWRQHGGDGQAGRAGPRWYHDRHACQRVCAERRRRRQAQKRRRRRTMRGRMMRGEG